MKKIKKQKNSYRKGIMVAALCLLASMGLTACLDEGSSSVDSGNDAYNNETTAAPQASENAQGNSSAGSVTKEPQAAEKKYANVVELIKSGETQNELQPLMKNSLPVGRGLTATSSGNKFIYIRFVEDSITQMSDEDLAEDVLVCQEIAEVLPDIVTDVPAVVELSCKHEDESVVYTRQFEVKN